MPIEEQLLPHPDLAPWYPKLVWVYVCRTWDDDERDREAARIHDRFGITSWPHLLLIDPRDDRVLARAGRDRAALETVFESVEDAVGPPSEADLARLRLLREAQALVATAPEDAARMLRGLAGEVDAVEVAFEAAERLRNRAGADDRTLDERLRDPSPHERILAVEDLGRQGPDALTEARRERLLALLEAEDEDRVVRQRSLDVLLPAVPGRVFATAETLLLTGTDPVRFALLDALDPQPHPELSPVLVRLFTEAGTTVSSGNPNVLRMRVAKCLVLSGDAEAIGALEGVARLADTRNVTTRTVVRALSAIAAREGGDARARVLAIFLASYPAAAEAPADAEPSPAERRALGLAEAVTAAIRHLAVEPEAVPPVPDRWAPAVREAYVRDVASAFETVR